MKVSGILTFASLCLAGLTDAAPVDKSPESQIVKFNRTGEKLIDYKFVSCSIEAFDQAGETESDSSYNQLEMKSFVDVLMSAFDESGLLLDFIGGLVEDFDLEDPELKMTPEKRQFDDAVLKARGRGGGQRPSRPLIPKPPRHLIPKPPRPPIPKPKPPIPKLVPPPGGTAPEGQDGARKIGNKIINSVLWKNVAIWLATRSNSAIDTITDAAIRKAIEKIFDNPGSTKNEAAISEVIKTVIDTQESTIDGTDEGGKEDIELPESTIDGTEEVGKKDIRSPESKIDGTEGGKEKIEN